jgi:DNA/RNA-binding domain of Phe-tRNA-synthetase-like protein
MIESGILQGVLAGAHVDPSVFALRPDYRAMLLAVGGLVPGPSDQESDALLQAAEDAARQALCERPVEQLPHVAAWREALFILDALDPMTDEALHAAADDLVAHLTRFGPDVRVLRRLMASGTMPFEGD